MATVTRLPRKAMIGILGLTVGGTQVFTSAADLPQDPFAEANEPADQ
jgi:hypothetical protein